MKNFLIMGYGVPKNILNDQHYDRYLSNVFNKIYELASNDGEVRIVFCGGPTDCFKPYKRTEAQEMIKLIKKFVTGSGLVVARKWKLVLVNRALSTLENLLGAQAVLKKSGLNSPSIHIFCEYTRSNRVGQLARQIFGTNKIKLMPIDFDTSSLRYQRNGINQFEKKMLQLELSAIKDEKIRKQLHKLYEEKLTFLRRAGVAKHGLAIQQWQRRVINHDLTNRLF